ncbi:MAG: ABC transporter permease [Gemmatimonadota bacterium]
MGAPRGLLRRFRTALFRDRVEGELDQEITLHLELETARNVALGMTPAEARRRALVAFGGIEVTRELHRDGRGTRWFDDLRGDLRYALRSLRRNPVLTLTAVLTLALGIGANTAIFSTVNAVMLRPLPFPHPDELVAVWEENPDRDWHQQDAAPANFLDWRSQVKSFKDAAAWLSFSQRLTLAGSDGPQLVSGATVTGSFFSVLGVAPLLGRGFVEAESWEAGAGIGVISYRLWRDRFNRDPAIIGKSVTIDRKPMQVVGVMPEGFAYPFQDTDIWTPMAWPAANRSAVFFRRAHFLRVIARLQPGVSVQGANAELQTIAHRLEQDYPATNIHMGAGITPLHEFITGSARGPLLVLLGGVAVLMLIACANVGNLLLVQAASRDREYAVRVALGASRFRLARQAITGSLVLSLLGGAVGLGLGWLGARLLLSLQPVGMLPTADVQLDWRVLAFVLGIATVSGVLFGLAPALWGADRTPAVGLRTGGRGGGIGNRGRKLSDLVIVAEVALAMLLTVGAGLLTRSLLRLQDVDPGFDSGGVLAVSLALPETEYTTPQRIGGFFIQLKNEAATLPGVQSAAFASHLPLTTTSWSSDFSVLGQGPSGGGTEVVHRTISPEYLAVMRVPLLSGRGFTVGDDGQAPRVVLINQALATKFFPGQNPIGLRVAFDRVPDSTSVWRTIVGVVGSERQAGLDVEPVPEILDPQYQNSSSAMTLLLRSSGDPAAVAPAVRQLIRRLDPQLAIRGIRSLDEVRHSSYARPRFMTILLLAFAVVGLLLAMVGVYGVMAQLARQRTREMSIRLALGARPASVRWLVVRHGLTLAGLGIVCGTVLALIGTRSLQSMLYNITPADPVTFIAVPLLLGLIALAATWLPAWRVSRADPVVALREE